MDATAIISNVSYNETKLLALALHQGREVQELRKQQLERDGRIWDSVLQEWTTATDSEERTK